MRFTGLPSLKTTRVGMDMISNSAASCCCSSTSTFTKLILSPRSPQGRILCDWLFPFQSLLRNEFLCSSSSLLFKFYYIYIFLYTHYSIDIFRCKGSNKHFFEIFIFIGCFLPYSIMKIFFFLNR